MYGQPKANPTDRLRTHRNFFQTKRSTLDARAASKATAKSSNGYSFGQDASITISTANKSNSQAPLPYSTETWSRRRRARMCNDTDRKTRPRALCHHRSCPCQEIGDENESRNSWCREGEGATRESERLGSDGRNGWRRRGAAAAAMAIAVSHYHQHDRPPSPRLLKALVTRSVNDKLPTSCSHVHFRRDACAGIPGYLSVSHVYSTVIISVSIWRALDGWDANLLPPLYQSNGRLLLNS